MTDMNDVSTISSTQIVDALAKVPEDVVDNGQHRFIVRDLQDGEAPALVIVYPRPEDDVMVMVTVGPIPIYVSDDEEEDN
jgi:hypothetical protein